MERDAFVRFLEEAVPLLEQYRATNVNKYWREKDVKPHSDYVKRERYKNRVRFVDCLLPPARKVLKEAGVMMGDDSQDESAIP